MTSPTSPRLTPAQRLDDYDWEAAFEYARHPEPVVGDTEVSTAGFERDGIAEILGIEDGENDECDWILYGRHHDGRYVFLEAGCDYTGWG